jgi:hypothetical protein
MIEGSGSVPYLVLVDPDPGGPLTYGSDGSRSGSAALLICCFDSAVLYYILNFYLHFMDASASGVKTNKFPFTNEPYPWCDEENLI